MFRVFRILILLFVFIFFALGTWRARTQSVEWKYTLPVNIYLLNGDRSNVSAEYLRSLTVENFNPIETFMYDEEVRHGHPSYASIKIRLGGVIDALPPEPPRNGSVPEVIAWSLNMRWWAYRNAETVGPGPQVRMFLLYFDPAKSKHLGHSTGLQKGLIGRVNVFASRDMAKQNNVVIAHEFLHTLSTTDKYDPISNQPNYPDGYADPDLKPLLPQHYAEIMAGRTPLSRTESLTPASLDDALIGSKTAHEINWKEIRHDRICCVGIAQVKSRTLQLRGEF
jgi:hypothetical protein